MNENIELKEVKLTLEQALRVIRKDFSRAEDDPYKITMEQAKTLEAMAKLMGKYYFPSH